MAAGSAPWPAGWRCSAAVVTAPAVSPETGRVLVADAWLPDLVGGRTGAASGDGRDRGACGGAIAEGGLKERQEAEDNVVSLVIG